MCSTAQCSKGLFDNVREKKQSGATQSRQLQCLWGDFQ